MNDNRKSDIILSGVIIYLNGLRFSDVNDYDYKKRVTDKGLSLNRIGI